jgi:Caspase domain
VGNNLGSELAPLRFAEDDAGRVARLLTELGGVRTQDLVLLRGKTVSDLNGAFARVRARLAAARSSRAMFLFYFSGHSDGVALEIGTERLTFADLRRQLGTLGAEVQVAIIDSCRSGALLTTKGAKAAPAFEVRLNDDLPNRGLVLLTSSAAGEDALESKDIGGSFFTSNLLTGLRGAADASGDGRVTLAEAYRYAYAHTVAETADTMIGPQHPGYAYQLTGTGEIVLTELAAQSSALVLPSGFERALVADAKRDEVLAELPRGASPRMALAPGDYRVQLWRGGRILSMAITVGANQVQRLDWSDGRLVAGPPLLAQAKGSDIAANKRLAEALDRYHHFDERKAKEQLQAIVGTDASPSVLSKAHLYLGIIALNGLNEELSREEFRKALVALATAEVPAEDTSPKVELVFRQAFAEVQRQARQDAEAPPILSPVNDTQPLSLEAPPPMASRRPHWLSIGLGALAVASAGVASYGGYEVLEYQSLYGRSPQVNFNTYLAARSSAQFWSYGWGVAAGVAAALGGSAVLVW